MNSNLISKNISGYFDDLINKPIIIQPQKQSTMSSFYKNYVEHNLLLIIIIIFIILFLLFKYFTKNSTNDNNIEDDVQIEDDDKIEKKDRKKIEKEKEIKFREKIRRERELLKKEKSEILSIIDELSEMNYNRVEPQHMQQKNKEEDSELPNEDLELQNKNRINYNNDIPQNRLQNMQQKNKEEDLELQNKNRINKNQINYNNYEAYTNNDNYSDEYYDIKENKSELIDGVYFETPYN